MKKMNNLNFTVVACGSYRFCETRGILSSPTCLLVCLCETSSGTYFIARFLHRFAGFFGKTL